MPVFNYAKKEVNVKVVYYGPGLSGKTTNIQQVHDNIRSENKGKLVSLATQTDRTLFFDFLPLTLGTLGNYKVRLHLYTVPGQVHYNATRKLVLKGVDGVVFVADSQKTMSEANTESFINLENNIRSYGRELRDIPHIIQANKRDLGDLLSLEELNRLVNRYDAPVIEAVANQGNGVMETLMDIVRSTIRHLRDHLEEEPAAAKPQTPPPPSVQAEAQAAREDQPVAARTEAEAPAPATVAATPPPPAPTGRKVVAQPMVDMEEPVTPSQMAPPDPFHQTSTPDLEDAIEEIPDAALIEVEEPAEEFPAPVPAAVTQAVEVAADVNSRQEVKVTIDIPGAGTAEVTLSISARMLSGVDETAPAAATDDGPTGQMPVENGNPMEGLETEATAIGDGADLSPVSSAAPGPGAFISSDYDPSIQELAQVGEEGGTGSGEDSGRSSGFLGRFRRKQEE